jgi:hypothetical protein
MCRMITIVPEVDHHVHTPFLDDERPLQLLSIEEESSHIESPHFSRRISVQGWLNR